MVYGVMATNVSMYIRFFIKVETGIGPEFASEDAMQREEDAISPEQMPPISSSESCSILIAKNVSFPIENLLFVNDLSVVTYVPILCDSIYPLIFFFLLLFSL